MSAPAAGIIPLSKPLSDSLDNHTAAVKDTIEKRARDLAAKRQLQWGGIPDVTLPDLSEAIQEVIGDRNREIQQPTRAERLFAFFPPFTLVCALLCAIFALLGWLALRGSIDLKVPGATAGFLDIAKIFAGAIVGSTSAVALKPRS